MEEPSVEFEKVSQKTSSPRLLVAETARLNFATTSSRNYDIYTGRETRGSALVQRTDIGEFVASPISKRQEDHVRRSKLESWIAIAEPFLGIGRTPVRRVHNREISKGVIAGLVGGLIGTIVMTQFQNAWSKASEALKDGRGQDNEDHQQEKEDATMKAAGKIVSSIGGRSLSHEQKKKYGPVVHYSFGTLQGGVYGAITELTPSSGGLLPGLVFGAVLFAAADELAVPALGLSSKASESPLSSHIYGLASHLVYGASTEIARRGLRASL